MKKTEILRLKSVHYRYGDTKALNGLSLKMLAGERLGVVGASGSGKSTLLKLISGAYVPDEGLIHFDGQDLNETRNDRVPGHDDISMMSQDFALDPSLSVEENIARKGRHMSPTALKRYLGKVKRAFHLQSIKGQLVRHLSGGQKQRTALAAALISDSKLLLLDEPFSQLDYQLKQDMLNFLNAYESDKSIIMVGHEPTDLMRFCDRIAVLDKGKLIAIDDIHGMFHHPRKLKAAQMTGLINSLEEEELSRLGWSESLFRPSHVFLKKGEDWQVIRIEYHAFGRLAMMRHIKTGIALWAQLASNRQYEEGETYNLDIKKP